MRRKEAERGSLLRSPGAPELSHAFPVPVLAVVDPWFGRTRRPVPSVLGLVHNTDATKKTIYLSSGLPDRVTPGHTGLT